MYPSACRVLESFFGWCRCWRYWRTNRIYPSGSSPSDSSSCQYTNFSGAEPSGWPIMYVSQQDTYWAFFKYIFLSFFSSPSTLLECFPVKYVIHYCRGQTGSISLHPTDIFQPDSRCMNKPGISQDSEQMAKPHSVSTFPSATWETHSGQMKHENSRHLQTLFILLFANSLLLLKNTDILMLEHC